ncbi:MAG: HEPN domain-containing protein [Actinomycetota bacterium]
MDEYTSELAVKHWLEKSAEDLATAKTLLEAGHFTWCAFICQQALEKCLKAGYVKREGKIPPFIHKLERLCSILKLYPPDDILNSIIEIDKYYIATRYPAYKEAVNISSEKEAYKIYRKTEEAYQWLKQALKL